MSTIYQRYLGDDAPDVHDAESIMGYFSNLYGIPMEHLSENLFPPITPDIERLSKAQTYKPTIMSKYSRSPLDYIIAHYGQNQSGLANRGVSSKIQNMLITDMLNKKKIASEVASLTEPAKLAIQDRMSQWRRNALGMSGYFNFPKDEQTTYESTFEWNI
jgi:hypothetical protein